MKIIQPFRIFRYLKRGSPWSRKYQQKPMLLGLSALPLKHNRWTIKKNLETTSHTKNSLCPWYLLIRLGIFLSRSFVDLQQDLAATPGMPRCHVPHSGSQWVPWLERNPQTCILHYWKIKYIKWNLQIFKVWSTLLNPNTKHTCSRFMVSWEVIKCHLNTFEVGFLRYHQLHPSEVIKVFGKSSFIWDFNGRKTHLYNIPFLPSSWFSGKLP